MHRELNNLYTLLHRIALKIRFGQNGDRGNTPLLYTYLLQTEQFLVIIRGCLIC